MATTTGWPPAPTRTHRLVLRESEAHDRPTVIELFASPEVGTHIGGHRPRTELERTAPELPGRRPGFFAVGLGFTEVTRFEEYGAEQWCGVWTPPARSRVLPD